MSVIVSTLLLAGSDLAKTKWEIDFVRFVAGLDQGVVGSGMVGFDLADIAWTRDGFEEERSFVLRTLAAARRRHRWGLLGYDPPFADAQLAELATLVERWTVDCIGEPHPWDIWLAADRVEKCAEHDVIMNAEGCAICHDC